MYETASADLFLSSLVFGGVVLFGLYMLFRFAVASDRSRKAYTNMKYAFKMSKLTKIAKEQGLDLEPFMLEDYDPFKYVDEFNDLIEQKIMEAMIEEKNKETENTKKK